MTELDNSTKPPQISEMFQKFALAFKAKTIEFFAEDEEEQTSADESDFFTLLDSAEEVITNQRVVVIKPDSSKHKQPNLLNETLIPSLFATIAQFHDSYLQLQSAHNPFDVNSIEAADKAAVSHLQRLVEIRNCYGNPNCSPSFNIGSPLEAQVQENQSLLRTLGILVNKLQSEIDFRDNEVVGMKQKLKKIDESNKRLSKRLLDSKTNILVSFGVFESVLDYSCKSAHCFTKLLIDLMKKVGWDLDSAVNSVYPNVKYLKKGHNLYAFLSYICLGMFQSFNLEGFGVEGDVIECNGKESKVGRKKNYLRHFVEHSTGDAIELLRKNPDSSFSRFCETKYQQLIHPTMESSFFKKLDRNGAILSSWRSSAAFYEAFVNMASSIWMLQNLAFSFDPIVELFQVERGVDFSMVYMEDITKRGVSSGKTRGKVEFTVIPGFKIGRTIIQCQVYLNRDKYV
ncbi:hypothetical protein GIB67_008787 [Kingdonia uniflora]|uniref:DUF641 domain-containing protein n=1 Tax=Kingdonia uniflora TaxID=39325 RepID=A0A7J7P632_9MAGN|nr:hypothetical protein GIB67_008787 [Kingdonia uniflora]